MREEGDLDSVSCSCTALWIFENEEPTVGGAVRLQSINYRIRQACSNLYLAVTGSGVDAFFDDVEENNVMASAVEGDERKSERDNDYGDDSRDAMVRPTTLCMIPPPRSQKDLKRTLFKVSPMFASDCNFLIEDECLVLQNVLTGMYVCTEETSRRLLLQWKPPGYDTIVARKVHTDISENVIFLRTQCGRLCRYRDAFQALISMKEQKQEGKEKTKEKEKEGHHHKKQKHKQKKQHFQSEEEEKGKEAEEEEKEKLAYAPLLPIIRRCQCTLKELIKFCSFSSDCDVLRHSTVPVPKHQRMMFDLHIHRLLFEVILTPFALLSSSTTENLEEEQISTKTIWGCGQWGCKPQLPQQPLSGGVINIENAMEKMHEEVHNVCCLAFRLLKQMVSGETGLKSGYDDFIPYFLELNKHGFHVVEVIAEIFQNNAKLPIAMVQRVSSHFVEVLNRVRSGEILRLLGSMCVVGFRGITERQAMICQKLLVEKNEMLCRFVLDRNDEWAVVTSSDKAPVSYRDLFKCEEQERWRRMENTGEDLVEFVQNEVELLGRLCFDGCPPVCCEEVAKIFPPQVLLEAVKKFIWTDGEVVGHPSSMDILRGHILRLAMQCYIMPRIRDPAVELRVATVLFGSSSLRKHVNGNTPLSGKPDDELIKVVKIATLGIIRANPYFVYSDIDRSILLRTSLNVWLRFVRSHQISKNETRSLIPPLLSLLDCDKDVTNLMGINIDSRVIISNTNDNNNNNNTNNNSGNRRSDNDSSKSSSLSLKTKDPHLQMSEANVQVMRARDMICRTLLHLLDSATYGVADEIIMYLHDVFAKGKEPSIHQISHTTVPVKSLHVQCPSGNVPSTEEDSLLPRESRFMNIFKRNRKGYHSISGDDVELTNMEGRISRKRSFLAPSDVVDYLRCACKNILHDFRVDELVPRLMHLVCYENPQLKAQSTELLIRLCTVKRNVAHRVLQVHTLPSIEVIRNFDHLYTVAVDVLKLQRQGSVSDAVALALDSVDEASLTVCEEEEEADTATATPTADTSKRKTEETESVEHPSDIFDTDTDDDDNDDHSNINNDGDGDDDNTSRVEEEVATAVAASSTTSISSGSTHTLSGALRGRSLWAKTAGAARMLIYRKAVRNRRRSMGLGESSKIPLRLVIRMEMVCHWRIHLTMLQMYPFIDPSDKTFFHWMRFFYLFTLSRSNARALQVNIDLFMHSLLISEECSAMCLHIIVAILSTIGDPTPYLTTPFLKKCVKHLDDEVASTHPDREFPSKLSADVFAKSTVSVGVRRRMLQLLRDHHIMRCLPQPGGKVAPVESAFIAAMVDLLCQICGSEMSAVSMGQQLLPMRDIFSIVMDYGTRFNPLRDKTNGRQTSVEKKAFLLVGTYLRALLLLYITSDEEEGQQGKLQRQMEWMVNKEWWAVVRLLGDQLRGLTVLITAGEGKVVNRGLHLVQRYRKVWLVTVPVSLLTFFAERFAVMGYYRYRECVETVFCELSESAMQFCTKLLEHSNALELQVREVVNYRRCLTLLKLHASHIDGLHSLANKLESTRNRMRLWLIDSRRVASEMEQRQQQQKMKSHIDIKRGSTPVETSDDGVSVHEMLIAGESASQSLQERSASTSAAGLFLSSAAIMSHDIDLIRDALRPFVRLDVLIPVEDSTNLAETASVINALLQRSPVLSNVRDFISNILDGLRKRLFSPIAFVGLLNCLHNALYLALQEGKNHHNPHDQEEEEEEKEKNEKEHHHHHQQQQQQEEGTGNTNNDEGDEEDAGYILQLTFSDLGVTHIVASLCALEDVVVTYSAMRLGVVLLDGGNKRAQNALMRYFETHQEGFFQNVRDMLQKGLQWVWRINTEHQLVILERGGVVVNVSNMRIFAVMLLTNTGATSSHTLSSKQQGRRCLSGWDRMHASLHLRLICTLFRMLQLFCEGHNLSMQNYIRCQHDNMHSVNILHDVMVFLSELSRIIHPSTFDTVRGGFELLTELCQGPCHANQLALLNYDVCSTIYHVFDTLYRSEVVDSITTNTPTEDKNKSKTNDISSDNNNNEKDSGHKHPIAVQQDRTLTVEDIGCLRISLTTCLLSLIEGSREPALVRRVLVQIPIDIIERELGCIQPNVFDRILNDEELEDDPGVEAFFKWLIFLQIVQPFAEGVYLQHIEEILRRTKKLQSRIGVIEIRRADGVLEKVFFRIPLICCGLTGGIKENVLWEINRTSRATKLGDFLHRSDNIIFKVERAHAFHRWVVHWTRFKLETDTGNVKNWRQKLMGTLKGWWNSYIAPILFSSQLSFYEYASLMVAVLANMSLIFVEGAQWSSNVLQMWSIAITCFCVLQLILSFMALAVDTVVFFPVCLYTEYRRKQHMSSGRAKLNVTMQEVFDGLSQKEIVSLFCTRFEIQFRVFLVFMAILSLSISHFFAAAHLLLVIYKTPTLRTFISAITQNGKQLLLTALLGVVVLYLFAIVGYLLFPREFGGGDDNDGSNSGNNNNNNNNNKNQDNENCNNLFRCFMFILWQGLRQGGGVGDVMQEEPWTSSTLIPRVSYDLFFFALVNVVFLNIMFGLIIDTFGELRDDKREKHVDMVSVCFICGLEADVFERARIGGFHTHVMEEHNMWMYLYFMHYLRRKDPNDFTGQESYVHEKIQENDLGFFPEEECLSLHEASAEEKEEEEEEQQRDSMDEAKVLSTSTTAKATTNTNTAGGMADSQAVALTLKELASVKEALSVFVRDVSADAQKVKSMIHQLEITSRSARGTSTAGSATHKAGSVAGTHVSGGGRGASPL